MIEEIAGDRGSFLSKSERTLRGALRESCVPLVASAARFVKSKILLNEERSAGDTKDGHCDQFSVII